MGRIAYLIVLLGVTHATLATLPTVVHKKCTKNDPRKGLYPECMQSESLVLWCDYSSYTSLPLPTTMYESKSCNDSVALYINDSCLPALYHDEIRKYPLIEDFDCGKNFIKELRRHLFTDNRKLRKLNFGQNEIHAIHDRAFYGLNKMEILNLTSNRLSSLRPRMFIGLTSLKELYLRGNQIQVLKPETFKYMPKLEVLVLTGNKIRHVEKRAFVGLKNLVRLHMDGNDLSTLEAATFQHTPNLRVLTLSYNKFKVAPRFTENSLINLHTLNLGHNLLRELDISRIANLSKLQNLSLENNSFPMVYEDSFHHMPSLRFINLSSNGIEEINQCSFSKSCHLEVLSLSDNTLKTPRPEWFSALIRNDATRGTDISKNQWKCDCNAIRFQEFVADLPLKWQNELFITCDWPKENFGKNLSDVMHSLKAELECDFEPYNKMDRPCNSSIPLAPKATEVYTYLPSTTDEDFSESTALINDETAVFNDESKVYVKADTARRVGIKLDGLEEIKPNESLNFYLLIGLCVAVVIVFVLTIYVIKTLRQRRSKGKGMCEDDKTSSTEKIHQSPPNSRSDSESSSDGDTSLTQRQNSTATVTTLLPRPSLVVLTDEGSRETTPFQPQDDLNSGSRISSDSGINSYPSSITSSEVALSVESNSSSNRSVLQVINENEVFDPTKTGETTPKMVVNTNQDSSDDNEEYLMFGPREQPIGGNADDEVC